MNFVGSSLLLQEIKAKTKTDKNDKNNFLLFMSELLNIIFVFITKSGFFFPNKLSLLMYPKEMDKILIIFSIDLFLQNNFLKSLN